MSNPGQFNSLAEVLAKSRAEAKNKKADPEPSRQAAPGEARKQPGTRGKRPSPVSATAHAQGLRAKKSKTAAVKIWAEDWSGVEVDAGSKTRRAGGTKTGSASSPDLGPGVGVGADDEAELFALAMSGVDNLSAKNKRRVQKQSEDDSRGLFTLADKFPAPPHKNKTGGSANNHPRIPGAKLQQPPGNSTGSTGSMGSMTSTGAKGRPAAPAEEREDNFTWHDYLTDQAENPELEKRAFKKAMDGVAPLSKKGRELQLKPEKNDSKVQVDANLALQELIDGKLEFSLEFSGEFVECRVVGLDSLVLDKLRAGQYSPEAHVDLHGQNAEQAHASLLRFIRHSYQRNLRNVIVVTGRGLNSPNGISVLRDRIQSWLTRDPFKRVVLAFCTARPHDGGPGALYVLLRKYKKSRGKIFWDRVPGPEELD